MTEKEFRNHILAEVNEYCTQFHKRKEFCEGDKIAYASRVYDSEEMINLVDSALDFWLTAGRYVNAFETGLAEFLSVKYCSVVNSGSSANLLAFMALTSPLLGERQIFRGDEVITVAAAFPTTVAPMMQYGAIPVFVDVNIPQYNVDTSELEKALSKKTKAVMLAHTLGNPFDIKKVKEFCEKHGLWLIEDNCDALGSQYFLNNKMQYTGTFGDIGTSSFYPPHHITMGEGGAVYTNNSLLNKIIRSLRDWGRDCSCASGQDGLCGHRFDKQYGELPKGYDHKYVYSHLGYNLKATEMQAAVGCAQLKKLPEFIQKRRENFAYLKNAISEMGERFIFPEACMDSSPSWFGFLLTCKKSEERNRIVQHLESKGIQTRMLFGGNLTKHPCFQAHRNGVDYRIIGDLPNTDRIMKDSFWVGVYPGMNQTMLDQIVNALYESKSC